MSLQQVILVAAIAATFIPAAALLMRGRSRPVVLLANVLVAVAVSFHLATVLRLLQLGPASEPGPWVYALAASAVPMLVAGYLLSVCFGRDRSDESVRDSRRVVILLGVLGLGFLTMLRHPSALITGYNWENGRGTIYLGSFGKAYICYLLIGIVLIGQNLERTYRAAAPDVRYRLRLALLGFFGVLGFCTFVLATGLLYSSIGLGKLIATSLPVALASLVIAQGYLRSAITDVGAPVSRNIVYTSFTALAAGLFVLSIGIAAQVAPLTHWSPDEILVVAFGFLAVLVLGLLLFSNGFQRMVRRYIDRNFYVNRYDYRTQWSRITESLENVIDQDRLLERVSAFLHDVFSADDVTIALRDDVTGKLRVVLGKGTGSGEELEPDSPLVQHMSRERRALLLDRKPHDFAYIPIYAEDQRWLDATASQVVGPLLNAGKLVGIVGMERQDREDPLTYEDVTLLDSVCGHVGASLLALRLGRELAQAREPELISQWSSMLLHDLKNYLGPLRMAATNLIEYRDNPETATVCARDIAAVTDRLEKLVLTLSELRGNPKLGMSVMCPNALVRETITTMQLARRPGLMVDLRLETDQAICGDETMLRRVLENLITNAVDAMDGNGTLSVSTHDYRLNGRSEVHIAVEDTGEGIDEGFLRERLFHPFATTKKKGLGLGLYQSRTIIQAHGGDLTASSRPGQGARFQIALRAIPAQSRAGGETSASRAGGPGGEQ
jgi:putative PEP-CTERM system histidine kinase